MYLLKKLLNLNYFYLLLSLSSKLSKFILEIKLKLISWKSKLLIKILPFYNIINYRLLTIVRKFFERNHTFKVEYKENIDECISTIFDNLAK